MKAIRSLKHDTIHTQTENRLNICRICTFHYLFPYIRFADLNPHIRFSDMSYCDGHQSIDSALLIGIQVKSSDTGSCRILLDVGNSRNDTGLIGFSLIPTSRDIRQEFCVKEPTNSNEIQLDPQVGLFMTWVFYTFNMVMIPDVAVI